MELEKVKIENLTKQQLIDYKKYCLLIDFGSETACYQLNSNEVIKFFELSLVNPNTKLFLPNQVYGNNTFVFANAVQQYCNKIVSYTMQYVRGSKLGTKKTTELFYNLSYNKLFEYIITLLTDCRIIANNGIQVFDCFKSNIILSNTGFRQIDCVDFTLEDKDPTIIEKENIRLICQTIWDSLIYDKLFTFLKQNNLSQEEFLEFPYEFIERLRTISQDQSDTEIVTLGDTKRLIRR